MSTRMNNETATTAAPSIGGGILAFIGGLTANDFAALCGAFAALLGAAYTAWKWHREARHAAQADKEKDDAQ